MALDSQIEVEVTQNNTNIEVTNNTAPINIEVGAVGIQGAPGTGGSVAGDYYLNSNPSGFLNTLSGLSVSYVTGISGIINNKISVTGSVLNDYIISLSGKLVETGINLYSQILGLSGTINNSGFITGLNTYEKILFVNPTGNDSIAIKGRFDRPYQSVITAKNAANANDTIFVYPGSYYITTSLLKDGVNWYFLNGAKIFGTGFATTQPILSDTIISSSSRIVCDIDGYGEFYSTGNFPSSNNNGVLCIRHPQSKIKIKGKILENQGGNGNTLYTQSGNLHASFESILVNDDFAAVHYAGGGNIYIEANLISGSTSFSAAIGLIGAPTSTADQDFHLKAKDVAGGWGIYSSPHSAKLKYLLDIDRISATSNDSLIYIDDGPSEFYIKNKILNCTNPITTHPHHIHVGAGAKLVLESDQVYAGTGTLLHNNGGQINIHIKNIEEQGNLDRYFLLQNGSGTITVDRINGKSTSATTNYCAFEYQGGDYLIKDTFVDFTHITGADVNPIKISASGLKLQNVTLLYGGTGYSINTSSESANYSLTGFGLYSNRPANPNLTVHNFPYFSTTGQYYSLNNPSGFLNTLSGLSVSYVTDISGILSNRIVETGNNLQSQINSINSNTGNFISNSQTGQFYPYSNPNNFATSGDIVALSAGTKYYFHGDQFYPNPSGYLELSSEIESGRSNSVLGITSSNGRTYITGFVTESGVPGLSFIDAGDWRFHLYGSVNTVASAASYLSASVYTIDSNSYNVKQHLFDCTGTALSTSTYFYDITKYFSGIEVLPSDRLLVRVFGLTNRSSSTNITFNYGANDTASSITPPFALGKSYFDSIYVAKTESGQFYPTSNPSGFLNSLSGLSTGYIQNISGALSSKIDIQETLPKITGVSISGSESLTGLFNISGGNNITLSLQPNNSLVISSAGGASINSPLVTGFGIPNAVTMFNSSQSGLVNSPIYNSGTRLFINSTGISFGNFGATTNSSTVSLGVSGQGVGLNFTSVSTMDFYLSNSVRTRFSAGSIGIEGGYGIGSSAVNPDVYLYRDAAGIGAFRNGVNKQELRVYHGTGTNSGEFASLNWNTGRFTLGTYAHGISGTSKDISITGRNIYLDSSGSVIVNGHVDFSTNNTFSLGTSSRQASALYATLIGLGSSQLRNVSSTVNQFVNNGLNAYERLILGANSTGFPCLYVSGQNIAIKTANNAYLTDIINRNNISSGIVSGGHLIINSNPPTTTGSPGVSGQMAWDVDYFYVCVSGNSWKRTALSTW